MLRLSNDGVLKTKCVDIKPGDDLSFMWEMRKYAGDRANCIGLAANQIGVLKRVCVIRFGQIFLTMLNPVIIGHSIEQELSTEGCVSFPGLGVTVKRWKKIHAVWQSMDFLPQSGTYIGLKSFAIQHEIDHLDGITILDRQGENLGV